MKSSGSGEMTFEDLQSRLGSGGDDDRTEAPSGSRQTAAGRSPESPRQGNGESRRPPLPTWVRVTLIVVAVLLLLVGIAGLVLPGIQGIVTILAGLALLSLVSRNTHRALRWSLGPWPKLRKRVERLRHRFRRWLHRSVEGLRR
jgi:hypothetical protein